MLFKQIRQPFELVFFQLQPQKEFVQIDCYSTELWKIQKGTFFLKFNAVCYSQSHVYPSFTVSEVAADWH